MERAERDAERDALVREMHHRQALIEEGIRSAGVLPGRVGPALVAMFRAMEPHRAPDGYLSHPVLGPNSDEVVELATAVAEVDIRDPKGLREALCAAQAALSERAAHDIDRDAVPRWMARLDEVARQVDAHRPLGSDGKHGEMHTPACGCELVDAGTDRARVQYRFLRAVERLADAFGFGRRTGGDR